MELAFRARLPGHTHLQLHELNLPPTRMPEQPVGAPLQLPWTSSTHTRGHRSPCAFTSGPSSDARPPTRIRKPRHGPDDGPAYSEWARPPRDDPPGVSLAKLRIRQPRRHRGGPRRSHYNQTRGSPVPAAPLWIKHRPCPLTRIWTTIDNPLIRSPERTSGSTGAPSQVPMCITRYLRARTQGATHLMTRISTLE